MRKVYLKRGLTSLETSFLKTASDGSKLHRSHLLLKDSETEGTEAIMRGLARLASKGWNVPTEVSDVEIRGKEVRRVKDV